MNTQEIKQELWENLSKKYSHLENYCTIDVRGIDNNEPYFHPTFKIDEGVFISTQCDTKNKCLYAYKFNWQSKNIYIEIPEDFLDPIITGYHLNKQAVEIALDTMAKVRNHINTLNDYTVNYITNILIGNSVNEVTEAFISELKANQKLINYMQKI